MVATVNRIPSINLPLTNEQGLIHPIWYEFFRSFISSIEQSSGGTSASNTVIAGDGILGTSAVSTVNVGEGEGIIVDANSVGVDIIHQVNAQAAPEDEILIADASDQSRIRKTSLRDVANLSVASPGGSTSQLQYNNNGAFAGDSYFTTDGAGTLSGTGNISLSDTGTKIFWTGGSTTAYYIGGAGGTPTIRGQSSSYDFATTAAGFSLGAGSGNTCVWSSSTGAMTLTGLTLNMSNSALYRYTVSGITASTTQTQGQGALTGDINVISTCANANDTVTLPIAAAGRYCAISNNGAQTLQIFPASGDNLGAGVNTATTLAAGGHAMFIAYDTTNWEQFI